MKNPLAMLRPPARAPQRPAHADVARELVETAIDVDAACLALVETLNRRKAAIQAAVKAGLISSPLGARAQQRRAVDQGFAATGVSDHATVERPSAANRHTFTEQARVLLAHPVR